MPTADRRAFLERLYDALNRHNLDDFCAALRVWTWLDCPPI